MEVAVFVDFLSSKIQSAGRYRVIDRMQRQNILAELEFSLSGCTDESCQLEIGKLIQAKQIIVGSMGSVGDFQILNIKLVDVETGETVSSALKQYKNINDMITDSDNLINELLNIESNKVFIDNLNKSARTLTDTEDEEKIGLETHPEAGAEAKVETKAYVSEKEIDYSVTTPVLDLFIPG
jgi:hypothetical protein